LLAQSEGGWKKFFVAGIRTQPLLVLFVRRPRLLENPWGEVTVKTTKT